MNFHWIIPGKFSDKFAVLRTAEYYGNGGGVELGGIEPVDYRKEFTKPHSERGDMKSPACRFRL